MDHCAFAGKMLQAIVGDAEFFLANSQPDLVLEFSYGGSVGMPTLIEGKARAQKFIATLPSFLPEASI